MPLTHDRGITEPLDGDRAINETVAHPSFSHPTLAEALCEVHVRPSDDLPSGWMGRVFEALSPDFPDMEPVAQSGIEFRMGRPGLEQRLLPPRQRVRYQHMDRPVLIQLAPKLFTINFLPPYPGWEVFAGDLRTYWERIAPILKPEAIHRIGLRYINQIDRSDDSEEVGFWIKENEFVAKAVLSCTSNFLSRVQVSSSSSDRLIVTLAEKPASEELEHGAVILDIDRISETIRDPNPDALVATARELHDDVWRVFNSALTDNLRSRLEGSE